jgi:glutamate dehydrogenase (NAD(P)+)
VEYHGGNQTQAFNVIDEKIRRNTAEVLARSQKQGIRPRESALRMAGDRVRRAMALRRWN